MRGWPILQAFTVLVLLFIVGLPLRRLTAPRTLPRLAALPQMPRTPEKISISVTFTQPPHSFSVSYLGKNILQAQDSQSFDFNTTVESYYPPEGIDLVFEASWTSYFQKGSASIEVQRADGSQQIQKVSGTRDLFEILTFPGTPSPTPTPTPTLPPLPAPAH